MNDVRDEGLRLCSTERPAAIPVPDERLGGSCGEALDGVPRTAISAGIAGCRGVRGWCLASTQR